MMKPNSTNPADTEAKIQGLIDQLGDKYAATGQDLGSYLEGLYHANFLSYWNYVHLDTLLTLQTPRTDFPDENIFIIYHQISELYFKLVLLELGQIADKVDLGAEEFEMRVRRANNYVRHLIDSFSVMYHGMEQEQFLKFRMALLPASGFQSAQFRMIEIAATDFDLLLLPSEKQTDAETIADKFKHLYWLQGATELATGRKTYTLLQFEKKYANSLIDMGEKYATRNLRKRWQELAGKGQTTDGLKQALKEFDTHMNVSWRLMHLRSAVQYLHKEPEVIAATGGTNWQEYLPPKFQKRSFYPELWNADEMQEWGKDWIVEMLKQVRKA